MIEMVDRPNEKKQKECLISIRDLHKSYGTKSVLKGIDLEVYEGELFGFIGKNGVGKSTTIDCVIGSKKFQQGQILLDGFDIVQEPIEAKYSFGYVASEPSCYEAMTGYEYLEFVASIYGVTEGDFIRNYRYLCTRLALDLAELNNPISDYSHGMKQKLCLVASLMHSPKIWILDEPTVGLDIMAVEELKKMLREYADHGKTVFVTSHNIDLVAKICDRVAIINQGKVAGLYDFNREPNRRIQLPKLFMEIYKGSNQK
ncbi:MAG: ABC transporter ATP-binding protein [Clostridia bacterium]|nr:ABC transporter ATP-binding protein [Clostridia bacterium]